MFGAIETLMNTGAHVTAKMLQRATKNSYAVCARQLREFRDHLDRMTPLRVGPKPRKAATASAFSLRLMMWLAAISVQSATMSVADVLELAARFLERYADTCDSTGTPFGNMRLPSESTLQKYLHNTLGLSWKVATRTCCVSFTTTATLQRFIYAREWSSAKPASNEAIIFVDESGCNRHNVRSPRARSAPGVVPRAPPTGEASHVPTLDFIGAVNSTGFLLMQAVTGGKTTAAVFKEFLLELLRIVIKEKLHEKSPGHGVWIVLDNGSHHVKPCFDEDVLTLARSANTRFVFLPPYSSFLDVIEKTWGFIKHSMFIMPRLRLMADEMGVELPSAASPVDVVRGHSELAAVRTFEAAATRLEEQVRASSENVQLAGVRAAAIDKKAHDDAEATLRELCDEIPRAERSDGTDEKEAPTSTMFRRHSAQGSAAAGARGSSSSAVAAAGSPLVQLASRPRPGELGEQRTRELVARWTSAALSITPSMMARFYEEVEDLITLCADEEYVRLVLKIGNSGALTDPETFQVLREKMVARKSDVRDRIVRDLRGEEGYAVLGRGPGDFDALMKLYVWQVPDGPLGGPETSEAALDQLRTMIEAMQLDSSLFAESGYVTHELPRKIREAAADGREQEVQILTQRYNASRPAAKELRAQLLNRLSALLLDGQRAAVARPAVAAAARPAVEASGDQVAAALPVGEVAQAVVVRRKRQGAQSSAP